MRRVAVALAWVALGGLLPMARAAAQGTGVLYGTVADTAGQPLAGVVRATGVAGVMAATNGRYRLVVPGGRVVLRVSQLGYAPVVDTVTLTAGDSLERNYRLRPVSFELPPTIVTAAKRSQLLDQAVTSVALVSDSDLAHRAVSTVDEAVNRAAGVQFLSGQVNIRGSSGFVEGLGSRVLLLVDGVPANEGDRGGVDWDIVPLADVARVEVVKGAGSGLYGSAALGGVVNVITREIPVGLHSRWRATGGVYANPPADVWKFRDNTGGLAGLDATTSYGTEGARGSFTVGGRHSDGYREQDRSDQWETSGRAEWRPEPGTQVTAEGVWTSHQHDNFPTWCVPGACDVRGQAYQPFRIDTSSRGSYTRSDKGFVFATLEHTASPRLSWLARVSWVRTHFTDFTPTDWGVSNRLGAELRGTLHATGDDRVVIGGVEAARNDGTSDIFGNHTEWASALYAEGEQRVGRARLTVGARVDGNAVDGASRATVLSPRLGAVLPTSLGTWRASVARGFRAPSFAERFVRTRAFGFLVVPNPTLDPETAWSFELGNAAELRSWGRLDAALFWTEARQLIEPVLGGLGTIQLQNVARARLRGLDASLAATPFTPALTVSAAYMFLDARDLSSDSSLAFRPKHLATLSADYRWRAFSVGSDFRYSSRIERIELEAFYGRDPRIDAKVLDLRVGWQRGPLALRLLIANALNYIYNLVPRTLEPVRTASVILTWND